MRLLSFSCRSVLRLWVVVFSLAASCGGSNHTQPFSDCGNGVIDGGEECDDGGVCTSGNVGRACTSEADCSPDPSDSRRCLPRDDSACTSVCRRAVCGDGLVHAGVEECDSLNLNGSTCSRLGLAAGNLACDSECRFDTTGCGTVFTPTATATETATPTATTTPAGTLTPTATPTATGTATPTPAPDCGNGSLDEGETCDDGNLVDGDACPSDCTIRSCTPGAERVRFAVSFTPPESRNVSTLSVLFFYPDGEVSIPGKANEATVRERVTGTPMGAVAVRNDLDYVLRVVLSLAPAIPGGEIFVVEFDTCEGEPVPDPSRFRCAIERASGANGPVPGASCEISERLP